MLVRRADRPIEPFVRSPQRPGEPQRFHTGIFMDTPGLLAKSLMGSRIVRGR